MTKFVSEEVSRLAIILFAGLMVGFLLGHLFFGLFSSLLLYVIWQGRNLVVLASSLETGKLRDLPEASGVWGEVYNRIYRLQQRNTRQKRNLATALTRFQHVSSALPDATILLHPGGEIEWCNDAAKRLFGIRVPHDLGQQVTNLIRSPLFAEYLAANHFEDSVDIRSSLDGNIHLNIRVVVYGKDQKLILARDVTRLYKLEQTRKDFVANVSHELRTPLTVLNGYLELLDDREDEALQPWKKGIHSMRQQSSRMQNIVEDLLLLSKLESRPKPGKEEAVCITSILEIVRAEAVALSGDKMHEIDLQVSEPLIIRGDRTELHSAISNLVSNAVRYSPSNGSIVIRSYLEDDKACISVKDTGIGIPQHEISRLTERFYRVDSGRSRATGGTGLGLAIVKHVLNRHDGELKIFSQPGRGSEFVLRFPFSRLQQNPSVVTKVSQNANRMSSHVQHNGAQ